MLRKLESDILASIKNKRVNVFFLFLLLAFVILIFTKLSKEYSNTIPFGIKKVNVSQEDVILNDSMVLNITLKTTGFKWLKYYFSKPTITIDFKNDVVKKDSVFIWKKSRVYLESTQFSNQVQLLSVEPEVLTFRYGINMVKKVPVKLHTNIQFSPGFNISSKYVLKPDSIVVVGPKSLVTQIKSVQTQPLVLKDVKKNISTSVKLKLPKKNKDLTFSNHEVQVKAIVEKFTEGTLKIPVQIINVPNGISLKYFPKDVNVSYAVSLSNFNKITAKDFKVICDYSKVINNQTLLVPELERFPSMVKYAKVNQQRIEFIILK